MTQPTSPRPEDLQEIRDILEAALPALDRVAERQDAYIDLLDTAADRLERSAVAQTSIADDQAALRHAFSQIADRMQDLEGAVADQAAHADRTARAIRMTALLAAVVAGFAAAVVSVVVVAL